MPDGSHVDATSSSSRRHVNPSPGEGRDQSLFAIRLEEEGGRVSRQRLHRPPVRSRPGHPTATPSAGLRPAAPSPLALRLRPGASQPAYGGPSRPLSPGSHRPSKVPVSLAAPRSPVAAPAAPSRVSLSRPPRPGPVPAVLVPAVPGSGPPPCVSPSLPTGVGVHLGFRTPNPVNGWVLSR